ncbi:hypothetical protein Bca4012_042204 [Brassica carinata]
MTRFPHIFPLQLPLPLTLPLTLLLNRIRGSCRFIYWFNNQVESISRFSNPTHYEAIALVSPSRKMALAGASTR